MESNQEVSNSAEPERNDGESLHHIDANGVCELRQSRILELHLSSLAKLDPLEACVGSLNAGIMTIAQEVEGLVAKSLDEGTKDLESITKLMPTVGIYTRLLKQVDRFAEFERRVKDSRLQAEKLRGGLDITLQELRQLNRGNRGLIPNWDDPASPSTQSAADEPIDN